MYTNKIIGKIDVQFTPRVFPTPMRESKIAEEDDWIAKNRRHLKKHGVLGNSASKGMFFCSEILLSFRGILLIFFSLITSNEFLVW